MRIIITSIKLPIATNTSQVMGWVFDNIRAIEIDNMGQYWDWINWPYLVFFGVGDESSIINL